MWNNVEPGLFGLDEDGVVGGVVGFDNGAGGEVAVYLVGDGVPADEGDAFALVVGLMGVGIEHGEACVAAPKGFNGVHHLALGLELKGDGGGEEGIGVEGTDADVDGARIAANDAIEVARAGNVGVKGPEIEVVDDLLEIPCGGLMGHGACGECQGGEPVAAATQVASVAQLDEPAPCSIALRRLGPEKAPGVDFAANGALCRLRLGGAAAPEEGGVVVQWAGEDDVHAVGRRSEGSGGEVVGCVGNGVGLLFADDVFAF